MSEEIVNDNYEELVHIADELNSLIRSSEVYNEYAALKIVIEEDKKLSEAYHAVMKAGETIEKLRDGSTTENAEVPDVPDVVKRFIEHQKKLAEMLDNVIATVSGSVVDK
ncbi:MAG: YlbF family regulator [Spirochaetes bacterium]|nr:YlbF family regulator [Spirochaetota bacterium]